MKSVAEKSSSGKRGWCVDILRHRSLDLGPGWMCECSPFLCIDHTKLLFFFPAVLDPQLNRVWIPNPGKCEMHFPQYGYHYPVDPEVMTHNPRRGLKNIGNSCCVNVLLQSYLHCHPEFTRLVAQFLPNTNNSNDAATTHLLALQEIFWHLSAPSLSLNAQTESVLDPTEFIHAFDEKGELGQQKDFPEANERFLQSILLATKSSDTPEKLRKKLTSLFYGVKVQRRILPSHDSGKRYGDSTIFPWGPGDINLPISPHGVQHSLEQLRRTEIGSMEFEMAYRFPPCLWIYLNRFHYDAGSTQKMNQPQAIPHTVNVSSLQLNMEEWPELPSQITDSNSRQSEMDRGRDITDSIRVTGTFLHDLLQKQDESLAPLPELSAALEVLGRCHHKCQGRLNELQQAMNSHPSVDAMALLQEERPRSSIYHLQAIVAHQGHANEGHYIAFVRCSPQSNERWWKCNDSQCALIDNFEEVSRACLGDSHNSSTLSAYCLLYIEHDDRYDQDHCSSSLVPTPPAAPILSDERIHQIDHFARQVLDDWKQTLNDIQRVATYFWMAPSSDSVLKREFNKIKTHVSLAHAQLYLLSASTMEKTSLQSDFVFPSLLSYGQALTPVQSIEFDRFVCTLANMAKQRGHIALSELLPVQENDAVRIEKVLGR